MIFVLQAGKGGFDPEWRSLRPFLNDRLKSVLTPADKPARSHGMCPNYSKINNDNTNLSVKSAFFSDSIFQRSSAAPTFPLLKKGLPSYQTAPRQFGSMKPTYGSAHLLQRGRLPSALRSGSDEREHSWRSARRSAPSSGQ
jgi:hypothetical protein